MADMIVTDCNRKKLSLDITAPEEALIEFRKLLFSNGLSVQEFLAFLFILSQRRERNLIDLIDMAKQEKYKNNNYDFSVVHPSTINGLYNLLEQKSPIKNQK